MEQYEKRGIHIIVLTETKIAEAEGLRMTLINPIYNIYTAVTTADQALKRESFMGVAILIKSELRHYIHNIESYHGQCWHMTRS